MDLLLVLTLIIFWGGFRGRGCRLLGEKGGIRRSPLPRRLLGLLETVPSNRISSGKSNNSNNSIKPHYIANKPKSTLLSKTPSNQKPKNPHSLTNTKDKIRAIATNTKDPSLPKKYPQKKLILLIKKGLLHFSGITGFLFTLSLIKSNNCLAFIKIKN